MSNSEKISKLIDKTFEQLEHKMKNDKQQTAVDWLIEQTRTPDWHSLKRGDILEQAKEMEKERTISFTNKYINEELWVNCNAIESDSTVEQYYEKTHGGNK